MQKLRVAFKVTDSPPNRYARCFNIIDGHLTLKCKHPGIEVEILAFLAEALKLDLHWIPITGKAYRELESGEIDMIGNLRGPDNMLKYNISAISVGHMYETRAYILRTPDPVFHENEAFLRPFKPMVWFGILLSIFAVSAISLLAQKMLNPQDAQAHSIGLVTIIRTALRQMESEIFVGKLFSPAFTTVTLYCCFVLHSCYEQKILNQMMVSKISLKKIMDTESMASFLYRYNYTVLTKNDDFQKRFIENPFYQNHGFKKINDRHGFMYFPTNHECTQMLLTSTAPVVFASDTFKAAYIQQHHREIYSVTITDDAFEYDGYLFSKAVPREVKESFSKAINLYSTIISKILRRYLRENGNDITVVKWMKPLKLRRIIGVFQFIVIGLSLSTALFFAEIVVGWTVKCRRGNWNVQEQIDSAMWF